MGTYSQLLKTPKIDKEEKQIVAGESQMDSPAGEINIASNTATEMPRNIATLQHDNIATNIAILQFNEEDIDSLRQGTYQPQTFRLREDEVEWLRDQAYQLSKEMKRGRVSQVDILRLGLRICYKLMKTNKEDIVKILKEMK